MHSSSQAKSEQNTRHLLLLSISHCILCTEQFQQSETVCMLTETMEDNQNYQYVPLIWIEQLFLVILIKKMYYKVDDMNLNHPGLYSF